MPWNFPFWQVVRFAAPALMAGNVGLLKHASNVPGCALALQEIFGRAGFPAGAFHTLLMGSERVAPVIADECVKAVTLTGSEAAGAKVAEQAGKHIKKAVLELGGSDPFIVLPSADLAIAASTAIAARTLNNGQSCIAAKRFIVHAWVYDTLAVPVNGTDHVLGPGDEAARASLGPHPGVDGRRALPTQLRLPQRKRSGDVRLRRSGR